MSIQEFFPTQIWTSKLNFRDRTRFIKDCIEEVYVFRKLDRPGRAWSKIHYPHGYTSYSSITDLPFRSVRFARLRDWIDQQVKRYALGLERDLGRRKLQMTSCWINIMGRDCHHSFHLHPLSMISGTFYLKADRSDGRFKIEDPRIGLFMASPPAKATAKSRNQRYCDLAVAPGQLVLFESWLKHEVTQVRGSEDRISISFNYDWQ